MPRGGTKLCCTSPSSGAAVAAKLFYKWLYFPLPPCCPPSLVVSSHPCYSLNWSKGSCLHVASCSYLNMEFIASLFLHSAFDESVIFPDLQKYRPPQPSPPPCLWQRLPPGSGSPVSPRSEPFVLLLVGPLLPPSCVAFCQVPHLSGLSFPIYRKRQWQWFLPHKVVVQIQ